MSKANDKIARRAMTTVGRGGWRDQVQATIEANKPQFLADAIARDEKLLADIESARQDVSTRLQASRAELAALQNMPVVPTAE